MIRLAITFAVGYVCGVYRGWLWQAGKALWAKIHPTKAA